MDNLISAEIPDKETNPELYDLVGKFMIHGPCGQYDKDAPCMKDGKCSRYFPKKFSDRTILDENGCPTYKRRNNGRTVEKKKASLTTGGLYLTIQHS